MYRKPLLFLSNKLTPQLLKKHMSSSGLTTTNFKNGIKQIVMHDPKTRNSLSIAMMQSLINEIKNDETNQDLRVIVISAQGPVFSAGHNLKELSNNPKRQHECFKIASQLMNAIIDSPVPIIGQVDGLAAAAGCQLVAQCDIVVCSDKSKFSTPGANVGIFCSTPGIALTRCVSKMPALYMLFTGFPCSADEAKRIGLVSKVCPSEQLNEETDIICEAILTKSRDVIQLGKAFYYKQIQCDIKKAYELGEAKMIENLHMPDCREGIQCFLEKRKPQWGVKK